MAKLIFPSGESKEIKANNGQTFTLEELYHHIDCDTVQMIHLPDGREMYCDENAKLKNEFAEINEIASKLLYLAGGREHDFIIGNVMILEPSEVI